MVMETRFGYGARTFLSFIRLSRIVDPRIGRPVLCLRDPVDLSRAFPRAKSRPRSERRPRPAVNALSIRARSKIARYAHIAGGLDAVRYRRRVSMAKKSNALCTTRSKEIGIFTLRGRVARDGTSTVWQIAPWFAFSLKSITPRVSVSPLHSTRRGVIAGFSSP